MIIELLTKQPDCILPEGQAQTLELLLDLGEGHYTLQDIVERSHLSSPLPFWSRLRHLEEKGLIRTIDASAEALPSSFLLKA